MNKRVKAVILAAVLFLASGAIYKVYRTESGTGRENRPESKGWSGAEICESTEEETELTEDSTEPKTSWRVYESLDKLQSDLDLPYVDDATFEIIKAAYAGVDFEGEFEKGNPDIYEAYKEIFQKLVRNEETYLDTETGKEVYLKDCDQFGYWLTKEDLEDFKYIFFDLEGDGMQELYVWKDGRSCSFKYDPEKQKIILWSPEPIDRWGPWMSLIGTGKVQNNPLMKYFYFYQYDENGEEICNTYISFDSYNKENTVYLTRIPAYAGREGEEVSEEIKNQGAFDQYFGKWYFRITKEQYDELLQLHMDAYESAKRKEEEVTYTYEEFLE